MLSLYVGAFFIAGHGIRFACHAIIELNEGNVGSAFLSGMSALGSATMAIDIWRAA